jgi:hypothetical protein
VWDEISVIGYSAYSQSIDSAGESIRPQENPVQERNLR